MIPRILNFNKMELLHQYRYVHFKQNLATPKTEKLFEVIASFQISISKSLFILIS